MASLDAPDLLARLNAGEPSAFEDAYRVYAPRCRAVAYRILQDDASAQDAVQEAFLALWRHRSGLVIRSAGIGPWIVVVARNAALAMMRSSSRRIAREESTNQADADPVAAVDDRALVADVRDALSALPDEQRAVITLAYFGGHTLASVAQATGAPLGTVKRRAQLALRRLAQSLGGDVR